MSKLNEVINSLTDENAEEVRETLLSEANVLNENNRRLYSRAKKAEGFEYNKETKEWIKKEVKTGQETNLKPKEKSEKLGELDYGQKSFITSVLGIKTNNEKEMKLVNDYLANGKTLDDLVDNKYFNNDLKDLKDAKAVEEAIPTGTNRTAQVSAKNTTEYWMNKGELPPEKDVQLRRDVIKARYKAEKGSASFAPTK